MSIYKLWKRRKHVRWLKKWFFSELVSWVVEFEFFVDEKSVVFSETTLKSFPDVDGWWISIRNHSGGRKLSCSEFQWAILIVNLHSFYFSSTHLLLCFSFWFQLRNLFARELPIRTIIHCILRRRSTRQTSMKARKLIIQCLRSQHERIMNVSIHYLSRKLS